MNKKQTVTIKLHNSTFPDTSALFHTINLWAISVIKRILEENGLSTLEKKEILDNISRQIQEKEIQSIF